MTNIDLPALDPDAEARIEEARRSGQDLVTAALADGDEILRNVAESTIGNDSDLLVWALNHAASLLADAQTRALIPYFDVLAYECFLLMPSSSEFESVLEKLSVTAAQAFPGDSAALAAREREWRSRGLGRATVQNVSIEKHNRIYWNDVEAQFRAFEWPALYAEVRKGWWFIGGLPTETSEQEAFKGRFVFTVNRALHKLGFADNSVGVAIGVWLDLLHAKSPHASNRCINNLGTASAEFWTELGASSDTGNGDRVEGTARLNLELIEKWIADEGYSNQELAGRLKASIRAVSSIRNDGNYHGVDVLTKLANLMNRNIDELYKV